MQKLPRACRLCCELPCFGPVSLRPRTCSWRRPREMKGPTVFRPVPSSPSELYARAVIEHMEEPPSYFTTSKSPSRPRSGLLRQLSTPGLRAHVGGTSASAPKLGARVATPAARPASTSSLAAILSYAVKDSRARAHGSGSNSRMQTTAESQPPPLLEPPVQLAPSRERLEHMLQLNHRGKTVLAARRAHFEYSPLRALGRAPLRVEPPQFAANRCSEPSPLLVEEGVWASRSAAAAADEASRKRRTARAPAPAEAAHASDGPPDVPKDAAAPADVPATAAESAPARTCTAPEEEAKPRKCPSRSSSASLLLNHTASPSPLLRPSAGCPAAAAVRHVRRPVRGAGFALSRRAYGARALSGGPNGEAISSAAGRGAVEAVAAEGDAEEPKAARAVGGNEASSSYSPLALSRRWDHEARLQRLRRQRRAQQLERPGEGTACVQLSLSAGACTGT